MCEAGDARRTITRGSERNAPSSRGPYLTHAIGCSGGDVSDSVAESVAAVEPGRDLVHALVLLVRDARRPTALILVLVLLQWKAGCDRAHHRQARAGARPAQGTRPCPCTRSPGACTATTRIGPQAQAQAQGPSASRRRGRPADHKEAALELAAAVPGPVPQGAPPGADTHFPAARKGPEGLLRRHRPECARRGCRAPPQLAVCVRRRRARRDPPDPATRLHRRALQPVSRPADARRRRQRPRRALLRHMSVGLVSSAAAPDINGCGLYRLQEPRRSARQVVRLPRR
jgi:hypothetical protein